MKATKGVLFIASAAANCWSSIGIALLVGVHVVYIGLVGTMSVIELFVGGDNRLQ